jgi:hypothetical protein
VTKLIDSDEFLRTDDLLLGDQNEITIRNDTHFENLNTSNNQQSDITILSSTNSSHKMNIKASANTVTTLDDSSSTNLLAYRRDSLTSRRLIDIRSHLLLNTALDAT